MNDSRRNVLSAFLGLMGGTLAGAVPADTFVQQKINFHYIYSRPDLHRLFIDFLTNVFHLYPVDKLDSLIASHVEEKSGDRQIYQACQKQLNDIAPWFSNARFSFPALRKQKLVLSHQTLQLLDRPARIDGYLEFGSNGRYLDALEEVLPLNGARYFVHDRLAGYGAADVVDRGQLLQAGKTLLMNHYQPALATHIPKSSLDLVTVYIGFHHCPLSLRNDFLQDIRQVMRPGASLIVRDHHANSEDMWHMVALAHDVFNMGTHEKWDYNEAELRNFYSLEFLDGMLSANGFRGDGRRLYQAGDPTHNALMLYRKV